MEKKIIEIIEREQKSVKFFGESTIFNWGDPEEKKEAETYLRLWKKFLLRRLKRDSFDIKIIDEQWVEREPLYVCCIGDQGTIGLKLALEANFHHELGK